MGGSVLDAFLEAGPPGGVDSSSEGDGGWLLFLDDVGLASRSPSASEAEGRRVTTVPWSASLATAADYAALLRPSPAHLIHLWGVTVAEPSHDEAQTRGDSRLALLEQAVAAGAGGGVPSPRHRGGQRPP